MRDLGTPALPWRDLLVIVRQAPPTSALIRALRGEEALWGLPEQLLATAVDALHTLVWQQTKDGSTGRNHPKPIPRPGVEPDANVIGKGAIPMDEMADWLGWERELTDD